MSYPKKLYFGTLKNRKMKTMQNAETEQQLRLQGWVDFAQLGKGNDSSQSTAQPRITQSSAECAELQQNYEQLQSNYQQLQSLNTSFTQQWNDVSALEQRLNELRGSQSSSSNANYETWTVKQLRDELEKYGITPSQDTRKADLIDLLKQKQSAEGVA